MPDHLVLSNIAISSLVGPSLSAPEVTQPPSTTTPRGTWVSFFSSDLASLLPLNFPSTSPTPPFSRFRLSPNIAQPSRHSRAVFVLSTQDHLNFALAPPNPVPTSPPQSLTVREPVYRVPGLHRLVSWITFDPSILRYPTFIHLLSHPARSLREGVFTKITTFIHKTQPCTLPLFLLGPPPSSAFKRSQDPLALHHGLSPVS